MADYFDELDKKFEASGTATIRGIPLDIDVSHPLKAKGYFPILSPTCVCVTDPCPCNDGDSIIIWLPESGIRHRTATEIKSKNGDALHEFRVMRDADLITETITRRKAASFDLWTRGVGPQGLRTSPIIFGARTQMKVGGGTLFRSYECGGNGVQYLVIEGPDGSGGTLFEYIPIGSCEPTHS